VPERAAPKLVEVPPAPVPVQKIEPTPPSRETDIALEQARKKKQQEEQRRLEELKREELAKKKAAEDRKKLEEQSKAAKLKAQQRQEEKKLAALREEQMRRMQGLASATGAPTANGTAQRSAGPSDSYGGRVRARVRPNIVFTDETPGNPTAEVEVHLAPDGTITSRKISKSSGVKSWDDAVLRALDKTEVLPRDVDGRVHTPLLIFFRPKD
jgi:colicin import membrane protein